MLTCDGFPDSFPGSYSGRHVIPKKCIKGVMLNLSEASPRARRSLVCYLYGLGAPDA